MFIYHHKKHAAVVQIEIRGVHEMNINISYII